MISEKEEEKRETEGRNLLGNRTNVDDDDDDKDICSREAC